jgi:hypothetical protein
MRMLGIVAMFHKLIQDMLQILFAMVLTIKQLYHRLGVLRIIMTQSVDFIINLFVKIKQNISHLVVNLIIQVQLIKVDFIHVVHKVGQLGQRLLTIAHKIRQHAIQAWKQSN